MGRVLAFAVSAIGDRSAQDTWDALFRDIFQRGSRDEFLKSGEEFQVTAARPRGNPVGDSYRGGHGRSAAGAGRNEWGRLSPVEGTRSRNSSARSSRPSSRRMSWAPPNRSITPRNSAVSGGGSDYDNGFGRPNTIQRRRGPSPLGRGEARAGAAQNRPSRIPISARNSQVPLSRTRTPRAAHPEHGARRTPPQFIPRTAPDEPSRIPMPSAVSRVRLRRSRSPDTRR
jgi:hypothetical protein